MKSLYELLPLETIQKEKYLVISLILIFAGLLITPFLLFGFHDGFQIVIIGASTGALYSILALGFSLIFGVAKQLKLSLGGYYVVAAYTMFFLLEAGNVVPAFTVFQGGEVINVSLFNFTFFTFNFNFNGILLLVVVFLPIIVTIVIMVYLAKKMNKTQFILLLLSSIISGTISVLPEVTTVQGLYSLAVIPIIALTLHYLEVSSKKIAIISIVMVSSIWLFLLLNYFKIEFVLFNISIFLSNIPIIYLIFLILAVIFTAFVAVMSDMYLLKKFRHSPVNVLIVTFALALVLQSIVQLIPFPRDFGRDFIPFGVEYRSLDAIVRTTESVDLFFGISIGLIDLITLTFSIIIMLMLYLFIWHTKTGMALRAVSQDEEAALLTGIDIRKITAIVSGIGMGLVGFASVLTSPYRAIPSWSPIMGWSVLILAIAIVTLGGMGSLPGTIIAAFLFAYIEIIISPIISSFSVILPFIAVILVMIFRPEGILGEKEVLE